VHAGFVAQLLKAGKMPRENPMAPRLVRFQISGAFLNEKSSICRLLNF